MSRFQLMLDRARDIAHWCITLACIASSCGNAGDPTAIAEPEAGRPVAESSAFAHEAFGFRARESWLVGDLGLPDGPPPYPAVVLVAGSGPASRHSAYYQSIAEEFLRRGFATLIWSKPGVDESTGDYLKQSMSARAAEVAAALQTLAARAGIDADRIGLWGISQAGWVMPLVPALCPVAFVISVSGPSGTGTAQDLYGTEKELIRIGLSKADRADALEHRRQLYRMIGESADYADFERRHQAWIDDMKQRPWYPAVQNRPKGLFFLDFGFSIDRRHFEFIAINLADEANRLAAAPQPLATLTMPVLAIYGGDDVIVDPHAGMAAYERIREIAGNRDVTVKLFEGADHTIRQRDADGQLDFAPGYLTTMGDWLAASSLR